MPVSTQGMPEAIALPSQTSTPIEISPESFNRVRKPARFFIKLSKARSLTSFFVITLLFGLISLPAQAQTFTLSKVAGSEGQFFLQYAQNTKYFVYFLEITGGAEVVIRADAGSPSVGKLLVNKPNGVYNYRIMMCNRLTSGAPTSCTHSVTRSVTINRTTKGMAVDHFYDFDALGRLTEVTKNGLIDTLYCYDKAGNRKVVVGAAIPVSVPRRFYPPPA